jgi:hypothetical protein
VSLGSAGAGAGHEADTQEARDGVQSEVALAAIKGDRTVAELARSFHYGAEQASELAPIRETSGGWI